MRIRARERSSSWNAFYTGGPHWVQGLGKAAATALEAPLRMTTRLDVLTGAPARNVAGALLEPVAETRKHWIVMGAGASLDEAMRGAAESAITFLTARTGMESATAYAYLSAAADFTVGHAVDQVEGVHCTIRKSDFPRD